MSTKDQIINIIDTVTATISNGQSLSDPINFSGLRLFAIAVPPGMLGGVLTFQMSPDGGFTWLNVYDQYGDEITATFTAGTCIVLEPAKFASLQNLRIRSGKSAAPVAQTADGALQLVLRII